MNRNKFVITGIITTTVVSTLIGCTEEVIEILDENHGVSTEIKDIKIENEVEFTQIKDNKFLRLVNKENHLDKDYVPDDLVALNVRFSGAESSKYMSKEAADALEEMFSAAKEDGINLIGRSGYRSYSTQASTYKSKVAKLGQEQADRFSAKPGASEHQTGLAIDIISTEYGSLHTDFQYTNTYKWLKNNCAKFGFILRYQKGKYDITGYNFEPWHYRYVGEEHAIKIMEENITLEEYLNSI